MFEKLRDFFDAILAAASSLNLSAAQVATAAAVITAVGGTAYVSLKESAPVAGATEMALESVAPESTGVKNKISNDGVNYNSLIKKDQNRQKRMMQNSQSMNSNSSFENYNQNDRNENRRDNQPPANVLSSSSGGISNPSGMPSNSRTPFSQASKSQALPSENSGSSSTSAGLSTNEGGNGSAASGGVTAQPVEESTASDSSNDKEAALFMTSTPPVTITAGVCTPIEFTFLNAADNSAKTTKPEVVQAIHTSFGQFFEDSSCTTQITDGMNIKPNISSFSLYYKNTKAEVLAFTVATKRNFIPSVSFSSTVIPGDVASLTITGSANFKSSVCSGPFTVTQYDAFANEAPAVTLKNYTVTESGSSSIFSDSSCSTASSSFTTDTITTNFSFFVKSDLAEVITLTADDAGTITAGSLNINIGPSKTDLIVSSPLRSGDCVPVTLNLTDVLGNTASALQSGSISLSDSNSYSIYDVSDSNCTGTSISIINFSSGESTKNIFVKPTGYGSSTLTASDSTAYYSSDNAAYSIGPRSLDWQHIAISSADLCQSVKIRTLDSTGAVAPVLADQTINLSDDSVTAAYYSATDTNCIGAPITSVNLLSGNTEVNFFMKDSVAESVLMTASDNAGVMISDSSSINVGPSGLSIASNSPIRSGDCVKYTVASLDGVGNPKTVLQNFILDLTDGAGNGSFYLGTDSSCVTPVTAVTLLNGSNSVDFYYKNNTAESVVINADEQTATLSSGTTAEVVGPHDLSITSLGNILSGNCVAANFKFKDVTGNFASTTRSHSVTLSDSTPEGQFYSDSACTVVKTTYAIASSTAQVLFYYKNMKQQSADITATSSASELTADTDTVNVGPYKLITTGNNDTRAGDCELITVSTQDTLSTVGNTLVDTNVSVSDGAALGLFYDAADTTCSGTSSDPLVRTISTGSSSVTLRYKNNTSVTSTITSSDVTAGLQSGSHSLKVGPRNITISGSAQMMASTCSPVTLTMKDVAANTTPVVRNTTVNIKDIIFGSGDPGTDANGSYYSDSGCLTGITSVNFVSPTDSAKTIYYKNTKAEVISHIASDSASWLQKGTFDAQTGPSVITFVRKSGVQYSSPLRSGSCIGYTITLKDSDGNTAAVLPSSSLALTVSKTGSASLFSEDTCTTALGAGSITLAAGNSTADFYVKDNTAENVTLQVYDGASYNASGLTDAQLIEAIGPNQLAYTVYPTNIKSGVCTKYTIRTKDTAGNFYKVLADTQINLTGASSGAFYGPTDTTCAGAAVTSVTFSAAGNESTKDFYYKNNVREAVTLVGTDNNVVSASPWLGTVSTPTNNWPSTIEMTFATPASHTPNTTPLKTGQCLKFELRLKDAVGTVVNPFGSGTAIDFNDGAAAGLFYSDSGCSASIASTTITTGTTFPVSIYYKYNVAGSVTIATTDNAGNAIAGSMTDDSDVLALGPSQLTYTVYPTNIKSGVCTRYKIESKDAAGNTYKVLSDTQVNLTGSSNGAFYAPTDTTCAGSAVTSVTFSAAGNESTKDFYYKNNIREAVTLVGTDSNVVSSSPWLGTVSTSTNNWPSVIELSLVPGSVGDPNNYTPLRTGLCTKLSVILKDAAGNAADVYTSAPTATISFDAKVAGVSGGTFYTDSGCTTGAANPITLTYSSGGSTARSLYYKKLKAESVDFSTTNSFTALTGGLSNATPFSSIFGPDHLVITSGRSSISLGECRRYTFKTYDTGSPTAVVANIVAPSGTDADRRTFELYYDINVAGSGGTNDLTDGKFYTGSTCSGATEIPVGGSGHQEISILNGQNTVTVYFKKPNKDLVDLHFKELNDWYTAVAKTVEVGSEKLEINTNPTISGTVSDIEWTVGSGNYNHHSGTSTILAGDCQPYTVYSLDASNLQLQVLQNTTIQINDQSSGSGLVYGSADSTCSGGAITNFVMPAGSSSYVIHYKNLKGEVLKYDPLGIPSTTAGFTAYEASSSRDPGYLSMVIGPSQLAFPSTTSNKISLDKCVAYTVTAYDAQATPAIPSAGVNINTTFSISDGPGNGNWYSDSSCTTQVTSPDAESPEFTMLAGGATKTAYTVYYKNSTSENVTFTITDKQVDSTLDLVGSTFNVEVGADTFKLISSTTPSGKIRTGNCGALNVETWNSITVPTLQNVLTSSIVALGGVGAGAFYSDAACTAIITSVTMGVGTNTSSTVYYKNNVAGSVTLTADDPSTPPGRLNFNLGMTTLASQVSWVATPANSYGGECVALTLSSKDKQATPVAGNVDRATTINIDDGVAFGTFYSNNLCSSGNEITSIGIANAANTSATFYYKNDVDSGNITLTGTDATNYGTDNLGALTNGNKTLAMGPHKLKILATNAAIRAGDCGSYKVATKASDGTTDINTFANETITLSESGAGAFYSDSGCSTLLPSNQVTVTSGSSQSGFFYYKDDVAESVSVTATHATSKIASDTASFITKERVILVSLNAGGTAIAKSACVLLDVAIQDNSTNSVNVDTNRTLNLGTSSPGGSFYASTDATCTGGTLTSIDILSGSSAGQLRYKDTVSGSAILTLTDTVAAPLMMVNGTLTLTKGPNILFFTAEDGATSTNITSLGQNECGLYKVSTADSSAPTIESNAIMNVNVDLSISGGGGLFFDSTDVNCSGASSSNKTVTILNTTAHAHFRYKNSTIETVVLNADDSVSWLSSGNKTVNVVLPCAPTSLKVEPIIASVADYSMTTDDLFNVKITALDSDGTTVMTCYRGSKSISFSTTAQTAGSFACGATTAAPVLPSETILNFNNGTATTSSGVGRFTVPETITVSVLEGLLSGTSNNITVSAGAICQMKLKDAAGAGGNVLPQAPGLVVDVDQESALVYAAGFDAFGNFIDNVTVAWSGTGVTTPWTSTTTNTNDTAKIVGTKIGPGTIVADWSGGGTDKTATLDVLVNSNNTIASWTNVSIDSQSNSLIGGSTLYASHQWTVTNDTVLAWRTTGAQSWRAESIVQNVRGSRSEFPSSVYLVGSNSGLDVIDATTNVLWARFSRGNNKIIDANYGDIVGITAINGKIFVALSDGSSVGGVVVIDLENDTAQMLDTTGLKTFNGTIADRNLASGWGAANVTKILVGSVINSIKSIRSGSYDLIGVATTAGATVIQVNGATLTPTRMTTTNSVSAIAVDSSARVYLLENSVGVKRADLTLPAGSTFSSVRTYTHANNVYLPSLSFQDISIAPSTSIAQAGQNTLLVSHDLGLTVISEHSTQASSLSYLGHVKGSGLSGFGKSLLLNGVNAYGSIAYAAPALNTPLTIEMWFNPSHDISSGTITLFERGTGNNSVKLYFSSGKLTFRYTDNAGTVKSVQSTASTFNKTVWHHVAAQISTAGVELWIDGSDRQSDSTSISNGNSISNVTSYLGANSSGAELFGGLIDDVRISSVARYSGASFSVPSSVFTADASTISLFAFETLTSTTVARVAGSSVAVDMTLVGSAAISTPIMSGSDFKLKKIESITSAGQITAVISNSFGYAEGTNLQNGSSVTFGATQSTSNLKSIFYYQVDSATDLDLGLCTSLGGLTLQRR